MAKTEVGGFFGTLKKQNADVTVYNVYKRFCETGRFKALDLERTDPPAHIFFDSDVAKWIESAAYVIRDFGDTRLVGYCDDAIDRIAAHQRPDGYFNSYFQVYEPENILVKRMEHELYCAGHLIEAAVAYYEATGKDKLLKCMKRYADLICKVFAEGTAAFATCGHPEIELALARLFRCTGDRKYLEAAERFVRKRGTAEEPSYEGTFSAYEQSHKPLLLQEDAVGHAVRALYLYAGAADVAYEKNDKELKSALERLYRSVTEKRMYVTGGVGSTYYGEAFTYDYDLPNETAYAETCAGIALMMFCRRMAAFGPDYRYADTIERALYNNVLSGISMDGKSFFYVNPLEASAADYAYNNSLYKPLNKPILERKEVFDCSCCPPNISRLIGNIGEFIFSEYADAIYIDQLISAVYHGEDTTVEVTSGLPFSGKVSVRVKGDKPVYMRLPAWATAFETDVKAKTAEPYYVKIPGKAEFTFEMKPRFVYAPAVPADMGRKAITYGPMVLCAESADNGSGLRNVVVKEKGLNECKISYGGGFFRVDVPAKRYISDGELYTYDKPKKEDITLHLIPYYQWANRGPNDMQIWFL